MHCEILPSAVLEDILGKKKTYQMHPSPIFPSLLSFLIYFCIVAFWVPATYVFVLPKEKQRTLCEQTFIFLCRHVGGHETKLLGNGQELRQPLGSVSVDKEMFIVNCLSRGTARTKNRTL